MDKITKNAIWEGLDSSENDYEPQISQPVKSQIMHCHKCKKILPADSEFCPYCQTKLYIVCPKCNHKYSSEFYCCNICGVNKEIYQKELSERQRVEKETKQKAERERLSQKLKENELKNRDLARLKLITEETKSSKEYKLILKLCKQHKTLKLFFNIFWPITICCSTLALVFYLHKYLNNAGYFLICIILFVLIVVLITKMIFNNLLIPISILKIKDKSTRNKIKNQLISLSDTNLKAKALYIALKYKFPQINHSDLDKLGLRH